MTTANSATVQYLREETAKWSKIVKDAGIKLEI